MGSSSSSFALALLLVVTLAGVCASSRGGHVGVTSDGAPEDHEPHQLLMMERFHGWMAKHGRSYATAEEKLRRFEIYRSNVEFIEAANRDGRLTYKLRENHFTDLTHEEFLATHTMRAAPPEITTKDDEMVITTRAGDVVEGGCQPASSEVPHCVNWIDRGKVTGVKDQGPSCRACWAFSAVAAIESAYAIAKGLEPPPVLSEQELIDCDRKENHGCRSGKMANAFKWVQWNRGIACNSSYPYEQRDNRTCDDAKLQEHAASIQDFDFVQPDCEEKLMEAVVVRPVSVEFDPHDLCFQHYGSGMYDGRCVKDDKYKGPCTSNNRTHALAIVGYVGKGDDEDKYWIAKNSWGKGWGDNGYVWLKKDVDNPKGLCGLATNPVYPIA